MCVVLMVLIELFGTPFMRQNIIGFVVGIPYVVAIIATKDGKHYVSGDIIDDANAIDFLWTTVSHHHPTFVFMH